MKYYAAEPNTISRKPLLGGIEITKEQYKDALQVLSSGLDKRHIVIKEGKLDYEVPPEIIEKDPPLVIEGTTPFLMRKILNKYKYRKLIEDTVTTIEIKDEWEYETYYYVGSPLMKLIQTTLNMSDIEFDKFLRESLSLPI